MDDDDPRAIEVVRSLLVETMAERDKLAAACAEMRAALDDLQRRIEVGPPNCTSDGELHSILSKLLYGSDAGKALLERIAKLEEIRKLVEIVREGAEEGRGNTFGYWVRGDRSLVDLCALLDAAKEPNE